MASIFFMDQSGQFYSAANEDHENERRLNLPTIPEVYMSSSEEKWSFDMRFWDCRGGAWENKIAEYLAASPSTDLTIVCPNGNRLSRQSEQFVPRSSISTVVDFFVVLFPILIL